jgi:glyoxylase-like metal-dependent hydrolase (beta-lactamase superfamily II)
VRAVEGGQVDRGIGTDNRAGCGKFFEGNAAEMHEALNKRLATLPDDTVVYVSLESSRWSDTDLQVQPGHEYTKSNVKFAISVLQSDPVQKLQAFADENQVTTGKFTIADEKVSSSPGPLTQQITDFSRNTTYSCASM